MEKRRQKINRFVLLIVIILVFCAGIYVLYTTSFFGQELPKFTLEPISTFTPLAGTPNSGEIGIEDPTLIPVESTPKIAELKSNRPVCGQNEPMFLLGLGIDETEQADVIRLVRVDFSEKRILVLSIPRDFLVQIPGLEEFGVSQNKINASYGYGEYYLGSGKGVVQTSHTIYQNYGVAFDRYVVFHFSNFEEMIDAVGGVDLNLSEAIGGYDVTGPRHFTGEEALYFARMRLADNDIFRARRQTEILKALFAKILQRENIGKIPGLGIKFLRDKTLLTDVTLKDILSLACFAGELNPDSLVFHEIPADLYYATRTTEGASVLIPESGVNDYIFNLMIAGNY